MPIGYIAWINHKWDFGVIGVAGPPIRYIPFPGWEAESTLSSGGWVSYELSKSLGGQSADHARAIPAAGRRLPDNRGCPQCGSMIDEGVRVQRDGRSIAGVVLPFRSRLYLYVYLTLKCYQCRWTQPEQLVVVHDQGRPGTIWPWILRRMLK